MLHGRDGAPEWGLLVCDVDDGTRCYARVEDGDALADLETIECVGRTVELATDEKNVNRVNAIRT